MKLPRRESADISRKRLNTFWKEQAPVILSWNSVAAMVEYSPDSPDLDAQIAEVDESSLFYEITVP
jgi:hypothetical protein